MRVHNTETARKRDAVTLERQHRPARFPAANNDILKGKLRTNAGAERLRHRLLCRITLGEPARFGIDTAENTPLCLGEHTLAKTISMPIQCSGNAGNFDHVGANTNYHRAAAPMTSAFISRTATASPTTIARAMMAWPIFSSLIPAMAATGATLR